MDKIKKTFLVLLNLILMTSVMGQNTAVVIAEEGEFSISTPETTVYTSDVRSDERRQLFNDNWKFIYGDQSNAQVSAYDDSGWDDIQLPHDYSLELDYSRAGEAESGYKLGGVGWYRKPFTISEASKDKRIVVEFGGVYMNASVYINGTKLGDHPSGYTPFAYDLTDYIDYEGENILAVRVDHKFPSSRWYSGSGIYRNVHLTVTDDVHVDHYGIQVSTPDLTANGTGNVDVLVNTTVNNKSSEDASVIVKQSIRAKGSEDVLVSKDSGALSISANGSLTSEDTITINNPKRWSIENPNLYEVVTEVLVDGEVVDKVVTDYGFRTFRFDKDTGFYLNNKAIKLKGVSMHSDQGSLGAAAHYRAMERQVEILQDMGVNAIRVTHNPAADEFIEIANRKGMLVIDEAFDTWIGSKNGNYNDYAAWFEKLVGDNPLLGAEADMTWAELDIKTMVRRGINAPSIISWSIGNEVMEGNSGPYTRYPDILDQLVDWVAEVDTTRPSTIGDNKLKANWGEAVQFGNRMTAKDGVVGFNYADGSQFDDFHRRFPEWKKYGAETASSINSRGVYKPSNYDRHLTSYDESRVGWGKLSADSWYSIIKRDFMAGEFVWTGFDYLGEPTPYNNVGPGATGAWPSPKSSYFGIVDTAGLPKDRFYFYQSQWNDAVDTLHILPAWQEDMVQIDSSGNVRVDVYSDASKVELIFKDTEGVETSLGSKEFTKYITDAGHSYQVYEGSDKKSEDFRNLYLTWNVPYADGTVYAKSFDEKGDLIENTLGRNSVKTFAQAVSLELEADRSTITADGFDLSYVTIDVKDTNGDMVEDASNLINVNVSGNGELIALDNGDQTDHERYDSGKRKAFSGKLVAIVRSTRDAGSFTLNASSDGLEGQSVTVTTTPDPNASIEKRVVSYTLPRNYYVKLGHQPNLVKTTTVGFSDGTSEVLPVKWNVDNTMFTETGTETVTGIVEEYGLRVSTNVTVIESVGALLNYSLSAPKGVKSVNLPSSRPIVLANGQILESEFPVEWEAQDSANYEEEGTVVINGTAQLFGETFNVTTTVRISDAEITKGANVASNNLTLTQDIPKEFQSDSLEAIVDGSREFVSIGSGDLPNPSVWTNYKMAQTKNKTAEIVFTFATAQFLGEADLYFYQDSWSARLPENVELFWSNEGTADAVWSPIAYEKTQGETSAGVPNTTKINYTFDGVSAVGFKIKITANPGDNGRGAELAVGLTEAELFVVSSSLVVNTEAKLDSLSLNGVAVREAELDSKVINTEYQKVTVAAESEKNAAITVLKAHENVVRVITESENHANREVYNINLDQENPIANLPANDGSMDYPFGKTTATAGNFHPNHQSEGHPRYAVDNNTSTIFHTAWAGTSMDNFWITLELEEATELSALRYLSRSGAPNGVVKDYKISCSMDNETWEEVGNGQWSSKLNHWSIAQFDEARECKFVRLTATSTYGDGNQANKFMSANEIRVRTTSDKESLETADVVLSDYEFDYDGTEKTPEVTVTLDSTVLEEGIDYRLSYENNVNVGQAKAIVTGIAKYGGVIETSFEIVGLNKMPLETLLSEIEALDTDPFKPSGIEALNKAVIAATEVLATATSQEALDAAVLSLQTAVEALEEKADTSALQAKLEEAEAIETDKYTPESVAVLETAIEEVKTVLADPEVTAETVTETLTGLEEALENLAIKEGVMDKTFLEAAIAEAKEVDTNSFTPASVKEFEDALTNAETVLAKAKTQAELDDALALLEEKTEALEVLLDSTALEAAIAEAKTVDTEPFTAESVKEFEDALTNAETVLAMAKTQAELDDALALLEEKTEALEVALDSTTLEAAIAEAKKVDTEPFTAESVKEFEEALKNAETVLESAASQSDIDQALALLNEKIAALVPFVNTSDLQEKLMEAKNTDKEKYTEASFAALTAAIEHGEAVLNDADKTDESVAEAVAMLEEALNNLTTKDIPLTPLEPSTPIKPDVPMTPLEPSTPVTPDTPVKPGESELPSTGVSSSAIFVSLSSVVVGFYIYLKNRKETEESQ